MNATLADRPVVTFGFRPGWRTSITTAGNEIVDAPITSDLPQQQERELMLIPILHYYPAGVGALPPVCGKTFFVERPSDQAGFITDAIVSSAPLPHPVVASVWREMFTRRYRAALPAPVYADEVLDWGVSIDTAPKRPSGTLNVTFKYAGRGTPTPVEDPWA